MFSLFKSAAPKDPIVWLAKHGSHLKASDHDRLCLAMRELSATKTRSADIARLKALRKGQPLRFADAKSADMFLAPTLGLWLDHYPFQDFPEMYPFISQDDPIAGYLLPWLAMQPGDLTGDGFRPGHWGAAAGADPRIILGILGLVPATASAQLRGKLACAALGSWLDPIFDQLVLDGADLSGLGHAVAALRSGQRFQVQITPGITGMLAKDKGAAEQYLSSWQTRLSSAAARAAWDHRPDPLVRGLMAKRTGMMTADFSDQPERIREALTILLITGGLADDIAGIREQMEALLTDGETGV